MEGGEMLADSPIWKITVLAAVVVAVTSFAGGGFTYGTLSDTESAHVELGAATDFGTTSAANAPTETPPPTAAATPTPTSMQTSTSTSTATATPTPTPTPSATPTPTPPPAPTPTPTPTTTPNGEGTETTTAVGGPDSSTPARLGDGLVIGGAL